MLKNELLEPRLELNGFKMGGHFFHWLLGLFLKSSKAGNL